MASNNRDVKMTLSVESLGQENITKLEKSLRDLAKEGGASADKFGHLADEIARLGGQNQALQAVKALADGTEALSKSQSDAQARVSLMAERLDVLTAATVKAKAAEEQAAQALVEGRKAKIDADTALKQLRASYDAAEKKTSEYQTEVSRLVTEQGNAAKAVQDLTRANQQAEAATSEAAQAQSKAQQELNKATKAYSAATQAAAAHNQALQEAGKAAEALGVDITDLGQAEAELQTSFSRATTAVQQRKTAMADMAEADRLAAVEAQGMLDLYRKGEQALQAEVLAQRDAVRATEAYEAAKAQALADEAAWQREAHGIVEAAEAAQRLKTESERLAAAQQELANQRAFEKQAEDAKAMLRAAEYVRFWEQELEGAERQALETAAAAATAANRIDNAFRTVGVRSVAEVRKEIADVNGSLALLAGSGQLTGRVLSTAMASARERTNELEREIRGLTGTLSLADRAAGLLRDSMGQIAAGNLVADAIGSLVERVKDMGREFITANQEMDRLQRTMTQLTGSSEAATTQIGFLRNVANLAGTSVSAITDSFIRFQASATASGMALTEVNAMFQAVTVNGSKMGMSSERVALALDALGQMASKGVISMEELRQQLGDSLPGATAVAAKGLGMTVAQLTKLVEAGQLTAEQFFPAFRRGLEETFGSADKPVNGLWQSVARLGNKFTELYQQATNSAAFRVLGQSIDVVTNNFESLISVAGGLGKTLIALKLVEYAKNLGAMGTASSQAAAQIGAQTTATAASTAAVAANSLATAVNTADSAANAVATRAQAAAAASGAAAQTALSSAKTVDTSATTANTAATVANTTAKTANTVASRAQAVADAAAAAAATGAVASVKAVSGAMGTAASAVRGLLAVLGGLPGALLLVVMNAKELGTWLGESVAKWGEAGRAMKAYEQQMIAQAAREKAMAAEREAAQAKVLQDMQREISTYELRRKELVAQEDASKKATEAEAARARVVERMAALYGVEKTALEGTAQAAAISLKALQSERDKRVEVVAELQKEVAKREELIASSATRNEKAEEELQKLRALLAGKKEELAATQANVELLRIEAAERRIAVTVYEDHSKKIGVYKQAMEDARVTLAAVVAMDKQGLPVKEALAQAQINLAEQTRLYNKGLADQAKNLSATNALEAASLQLKTTALNVRQQELQSLAVSARARGDEAAAIRYEIQQREIQLRILMASIEPRRVELANTLKQIDLDIQAAEAKGKLTQAQQDEFAARKKKVEIQQEELKLSKVQADAIEREIAALRNGTAARGGATNAINTETAALAANTSEREQAIAAREKELDLAKREEALRTRSASNELGSPTAIMNFLKGAGLNDETAKEVTKEFLDNQGNVRFMNTPGQAKYGGSTLSQALLKAAEQYTFGGKQQLGGSSTSTTDSGGTTSTAATKPSAGGSSGGGTSSSGPAAPTRGSTKTVVINYRDTNTQIGVASDQDANNLVGFLRQLETDGGRAS